MRFSVLLVSLTYLIGQRRVLSGIFNAGPYDLKLIRHELCEDQGTAEAFGDFHTVKRSTHKMFMHGIAILPFDYDDTIQAQLKFSRLGSRGWGNNAYILNSKMFCSDFRNNYPTLFDFYYKGWGIEKPSCPIKAGNYTMEMDTDLPRLSKLPLLLYGTYRLSYSLLRGDPPVRFICNMWYISCTERPR